MENRISQLYKSGLSVTQIAEDQKVSPSKIRYSLQKQKIPFRNHSLASRMLHLTKFGKATFSIKKKLSAKENDLKIAGIMLYWGEGTKAGNSVVFSNSDPSMIKLFLHFLRQICGAQEDRLRLLLHMYPDQDEDKLKLFWSETTKIPLSRFSKTFYHTGKAGSYTKRSEFGTVSLRYSDTELLRIINKWINQHKMPI